jgi:membrane fusion protein, multidrug efflux system
MSNDGNRPEKKRGVPLVVGGVLVIIVAIILVAALVIKKEAGLREERSRLETGQKAGQRVYVVTATPAPDTRSVVMTGEARPYATVTLYSKVSGYIREIRVDKGEHVERGQVLAVIESPEIDRQVDAAAADARSKGEDARRARRLFPGKGISQQDLERAEAAAQIAEANLASALSQKEYELIRAPFAGTVTVRYVDPGALVQSAVNAQTTALPVVVVSRTDRLRVYVYMDQRNANFVRVGDQADILDTARPEVRLAAMVTRISGELDPRTRTLLTELEVGNHSGKILAGSFVQVNLRVRTGSHVEVPAEALTVRGEKPYVAVLGTDSKVRIRPVTIAESDGKTLRLREGIKAGEKVVVSPGAGLADGEHVQPVSAQK